MSSSNTPLPSSFDGDADFYEESRWTKFTRRLREEPLVPLGILLTCGALVGATRAMRQNDHQRANIMFRRRIYAQFFTIAAIVAGSAYWSKDREKRKELERVEGERKAAERREKWLAELDARDAEDREMRERVRERRKDRLGGERERPMEVLPVDTVVEDKLKAEGGGGFWRGLWSRGKKE